MTVTDNQLVQRALDDRRAFGALYERYADRIYRFALQRVQSHDQADDIVGETMLAILEQLDRFDPERGSFGAWIFTIASRRIADSQRRRRRFWRLASRVRSQSPSPTDETVDEVVRSDEYERMRGHLARLSSRDREVLHLRYAAGLSNVEIAELIDISPTNVRVRLHRARARLGAEMGRSDG